MRLFPLIAVAAVYFLPCVLPGTARGDLVVNVNGFNGSPGVFGSGADIEQFLTAGNYTFTLVNNVAGHSSYHAQANYTAWSFHNPGATWGTGYSFNYDDGDSGNDEWGVPPYAGPDRLGGGKWSGVTNALDAFNDAAAANALTRQVYIQFDQTIGFYFSDNVISDNAGGVSILIEQSAIPEPGFLSMFGVAGCALILMRRRRPIAVESGLFNGSLPAEALSLPLANGFHPFGIFTGNAISCKKQPPM